MSCGGNSNLNPIGNIAKPAYHLGEFPAIPKYSKEFYQTVPAKDKELMVEREFKLYQWKDDAKRLESLYNK
jgi:hypothetical protein